MSDLLAILVPGRPLVNSFVNIDANRLFASIPLTQADVALRQIGVSLLRPVPQGLGIGVYYSLKEQGVPPSEWMFLGVVDNNKASDFFRLSMMIDNYLPAQLASMTLHIGLNLETQDELAQHVTTENVDTQRSFSSAKKIASDLYKFICSFDGKVPNNVFDLWFARFERRAAREPFFWLNQNDA